MNVLQYIGRSLTTRKYPGANVSNILAETLDLKYSIVSSFYMLISSCSLIFLIWSSENMIQSFYSTVGSIQTRFYSKILKNYSFLLVKLLPSITHEYIYIYIFVLVQVFANILIQFVQAYQASYPQKTFSKLTTECFCKQRLEYQANNFHTRKSQKLNGEF